MRAGRDAVLLNPEGRRTGGAGAGGDRHGEDEERNDSDHVPGPAQYLSVSHTYLGVCLNRYTESDVGPGALLRKARTSARLSQEELARRAGTSQSAVNRYERGAAVPTLATLERLLIACGRELTLSSRRLPSDPAHGVRVHAGRLLDTAAKYGVRNIRVFGSAARGTAGPQSDIDLLVDLDPGRTLLDLVGFGREASEILARPVDVATVGMLKERIRERVLTDAVPL